MREILEPARFAFDEWMVAWTPMREAATFAGWAGGKWKPGTIEVGFWPDQTGWSNRYQMTTGCCMLDWHESTLAQKVAMLFIHFHTAVVRDGVDPQQAHKEFLKIAEYRKRISPDIHGAECGS